MKKNIEAKTKKSNTKSGLIAQVLDIKGNETGTKELSKNIFGVTSSDKLLNLYVRVYLSRQRKNTAKVKTRGLVKGSTRKIYKQKGTGRARHGDIKAPIFVGGGVVHGPLGKRRRLKINKKQKVKALLSALNKHARNKKVYILAGTSSLNGKTKEFAQFVSATSSVLPKSKLFIYGSKDGENFHKTIRNFENITYAFCGVLNAYDALKSSAVIFTENGLSEFIQNRVKKLKQKDNENK